jgi:uncharacterized protein YecE (DUF72 family)
MVMGWTKYSPEGFVFTAKLPQLITHEKKLDLSQGVEEDLQRFVEVMEPLWLSGKLGCMLIQLPPRLTNQPKEMEAFFKILPTQVRFAVEFRDHSWMRQETWTLLEKYKVAYTVVDEPLLPPEVHVTSNIAYFRWHGRGTRPWYNYRYPAEELEPWIPKFKETTRKVDKVYGYFNNHYHGYAVENCLQVLEMLGIQTPQQKAAKTKVENYFKDRSKIKEFKLEAFAEPTEMNFEKLLRYFVAPGRLERALDIGNEELTIQKETGENIEATIREYHIIIDLKNSIILHDCADWGKILSTRKLCKHIAKLLLTIDREKATGILRNLYAQRDTWQFKSYTSM